MTTTRQARTVTDTSLTIAGSQNVRTSHGDRGLIALQTMSIGVHPCHRPEAQDSLLSSSTKLTSVLVSTDTIQGGYDDGLDRYAGVPNEFRGGFGQNIISDDTGTVQVYPDPTVVPPLLVPSTHPGAVQYQTSGATRSFNTGTRQVRITSDAQNREDIDLLKDYRHHFRILGCNPGYARDHRFYSYSYHR